MTRRILVIDDDNFIREMLRSSLAGKGFDVRAVGTRQQFAEELDRYDPHVVMVDLDLGPGPSGLQLLTLVETNYPSMAKIMVTSHRSPRLVDESDRSLSDVTYLVKADIRSADQIVSAVTSALAGQTIVVNEAGDAVHLTKGQTDILRMIAAGMSNEAIAQARNSSGAAVQKLINRTYAALGVSATEGTNARILAIKMLENSQVILD